MSSFFPIYDKFGDKRSVNDYSATSYRSQCTSSNLSYVLYRVPYISVLCFDILFHIK